MAGETMTAADYIKHHLQSLTSMSDVTQGQGLKNIADFSFINLDAIFFCRSVGRNRQLPFVARCQKKRRPVFPVVSKRLLKFCSNSWMTCVKALSITNNRVKPLPRWV